MFLKGLKTKETFKIELFCKQSDSIAVGKIKILKK